MNTYSTIVPNRRNWLAAAAALCCMAAASAHAQQAGSQQQLERVLVTGNPLANVQLLQPGQALAGEALTLRRGSSLGDTLDGLAGVSSTAFGPNVGRPVLRGLDGDRVRLLSNAGASLDASSLSFDHAVPVDPLVVERVELLRGPAALLYGGSALGGVVNTLDNRIPRQRQDGLSGAAELRLGGAASERSGALVLDGGQGRFAWHADLAGHKTDDQRAPAYLLDGETARQVRNSAADGHAGALGAALHFDQGHAGFSYDDYRKDYGVTVEPDVGIRMQRQRLAAAGQWRWSEGPLRQLQWQFSRAHYEHVEVEGEGEIGTRFKNRGNDGRVELRHAPLGALDGVIGMQWETAAFSALGDEALVPASNTRSRAVFVLEQYRHGPLTLAAGLRRESVDVDSAGDAADVSEPRFGAAVQRRFSPRSASLQAGWALTPAWSLQLNLADTQRAPAFYELYADGVHVASGAYERGDVNLGLEKARSVDLGLQWSAGGSSLKLNAYETRFASYIALSASGAEVEVDGEAIPEYLFRSVPARLRGIELEARHRLAQRLAGWQLTLDARYDAVRGIDRSSGEALPRLAPQRASFAIEADSGPWLLAAEIKLVARQTRVPAFDSATPGHGLLKLSLARRLQIGSSDALWYLKLDNLGNALAYNAGSIATVRGLSPQPARSLMTGLQLRF